jgi:hypothetical protein
LTGVTSPHGVTLPVSLNSTPSSSWTFNSRRDRGYVNRHKLIVTGFWLGNPEWSGPVKAARHVATAVRLIDEGKLKIPVAAVYPFTSAKETIAHAQRGRKVPFKPAGA